MHPRQNPAANKALLACAFWVSTQIGVAAAPAGPDTPKIDSVAVAKPDSAPRPAVAEPERYEPYLDRDSSRGDALLAAVPSSRESESRRVGFSGFFESRLFANRYADHAPWMAPDASGSRLQGRLGLRVSAAANAHMAAQAAVTFADDFSGRFLNARSAKSPRRVAIPGVGEGPDTAFGDGYHYPGRSGTSGSGAGLFEELLAEVELKSPWADARARAGTTVWLQGSPLTLWNRDPRPKQAWYYEEFEPEMSSVLYYEAKAYGRGADLGRHAWPKRPFAGLSLETTRMPHGLGLQFTLADASSLLPTEQGGYAASQTEGGAALLESAGLGDLGRLYHLRASRRGARHGLAFNALTARLPQDLILQQDFSSLPARGFAKQFKHRRAPHYVNPQVAALEAGGALSPELAYHGELALSLDDTVRYLPVTGTDSAYDGRSGTRHLRGPPAAAAWFKLSGAAPLPFATEFTFAAPRFRSPFSMHADGLPDAREDFLLGAGTWHSQSNLAGLQVKLAPALTSGFLVLRAGHHMQVAAGPDVIRFQHTLNGRELWESTTSSTRADALRLLDQGQPRGTPRHRARLGETSLSPLPLHGEQAPGGLRGVDRETWEEFAAYPDKASADAGKAPRNRKHATTLALDWGLPIQSWFGLWRPMQLNLYAEAGAVGTDWTALSGNPRSLLWTGKVRFEPALSLTSDFHLLLQAGAESFRSRHAWTSAGTPGSLYDPLSPLAPQSQGARSGADAVKAPIDYLQASLGLGCDWDFTPRAGLHLRVKRAGHQDAGLPENDWAGIFLFAGLKVWI